MTRTVAALLALAALAACARESTFDPVRFGELYRAATPEERRELVRPVCLFRRSGAADDDLIIAEREVKECIDARIALSDDRYL